MMFVTERAPAESWEQRRRETIRAQLAIGVGVSLAIGALWMEIPSLYMILGIAFAPIAIVTVLRMPFILYVSFISLSFFRLHEIYTPLSDLHLPLVLAMLSISALVALLVTGWAKPFWRPEFTVLSLLAALATVGIALAIDRPVAWAFWTDSFSKVVLMVFAIAWCARAPRDLVLTSNMFILCGIFVGAVALWNQVHGISLVEGTRVAIARNEHGVLSDPNDLALVLLFPMSFSLANVTAPRIGFVARLLGAVGATTVFFAILATQSRGGLLGLAAVAAVFGARLFKSRAVALSIGAGAASALFAIANIASRISGGEAEEGIGDSAQGRIDAWWAAVRMAETHPFTGVGLNNFSENFFFYTDNWNGHDTAVHSIWFGVLAETGPIGLGLYVTMVVMVVRRAMEVLNELDTAKRAGLKFDPEIYAVAQAVLAGLAGFIVSGSFLTQAFAWPIFVLIAFTMALTRFSELGMLCETPGSPATPQP